MQIIYTSLQTDNHASISPLNFYRLDTLPGAETSASKHSYSTPFSIPQSLSVGRYNKNSSGDEIVNANFLTSTSYNTSKYNPLLNI